MMIPDTMDTACCKLSRVADGGAACCRNTLYEGHAVLHTAGLALHSGRLLVLFLPQQSYWKSYGAGHLYCYYPIILLY